MNSRCSSIWSRWDFSVHTAAAAARAAKTAPNHVGASPQSIPPTWGSVGQPYDKALPDNGSWVRPAETSLA
ncbi:hypothetical protein GCM10010405_34910 [Streptomyces macrosporus]|uniref:Uncharacterized protein n=1 Tax=Streptomyces macrosporus TaxID=44032 RepID=A0ABN3K4B9_9ACTN